MRAKAIPILLAAIDELALRELRRLVRTKDFGESSDLRQGSDLRDLPDLCDTPGRFGLVPAER
jgi:hypothetical protein